MFFSLSPSLSLCSLCSMEEKLGRTHTHVHTHTLAFVCVWTEQRYANETWSTHYAVVLSFLAYVVLALAPARRRITTCAAGRFGIYKSN
jgi:hypothetical protein